jgi:hypothetical protein
MIPEFSTDIFTYAINTLPMNLLWKYICTSEQGGSLSCHILVCHTGPWSPRSLPKDRLYLVASHNKQGPILAQIST